MPSPTRSQASMPALRREPPARSLRRYLRHGTLPQLAAFDTAMRLGSLSQAAEALHMAQPTMTGLMQRLGQTLGVTLFHAEGRRRVPTPAAHAVHAAMDPVFSALSRLDETLRPLRGEA